MTDTRDDCRRAFEACTNTYYEGDFTKYEPNGDYVSEQQQDDFMMFSSGYNAAMKATPPAQPNVEELIAAIKDCGDDAYCRAIDMAMHTPECLGEDYKIQNGKFGKPELEAHRKEAGWMAKHRGAYEIIAIIRKWAEGKL